MPVRSAVSLLVASAPTQRQCLCSFLYPPPALVGAPTHSPTRQHDDFARVNVVRRRPFHSTAARADDAIDNARNHYETLKVSPSASASEIKKSFYALSKTHHPDLQEVSGRRAAAKRFMRISEAYSILSSATKRAKYDREHMNIAHPAHAAHAHRKGSYASTGPAGGRPASGLSRRRGTFRGPPPSFFRSGGWGAQSEKRKTAHEESTGGAASASASRPGAGAGQTSGKGTAGGMGPGQDPFGHRDDVPHFDKESHERTGRNIDRRREARRGVENDFGERVPIEIDRGVAGMFFVISGILLLSFAGPFFISRLWYGGGQRSKEKGKDPAKG